MGLNSRGKKLRLDGRGKGLGLACFKILLCRLSVHGVTERSSLKGPLQCFWYSCGAVIMCLRSYKSVSGDTVRTGSLAYITLDQEMYLRVWVTSPLWPCDLIQII